MSIWPFPSLIVVLSFICYPAVIARDASNISVISRNSFPEGFIFGTASASYQYEGAANEGGRGPSIWDTFTHEHPEKIIDRSNGDVAVDQYHRYKQDVKLMKDIGFDAYRLSISWSRILPSGKSSGGVNKVGIAYYNNLINELLSRGLKPFITLFHWDVPQNLEREYGGFRSSKIIEDFKNYADICFQEFGDRVKNWITLNEPHVFALTGYSQGRFAPGRCTKVLGCTAGNSGTEPYIVAHNLLLAHAHAVKAYKKYQKWQKGEIGITLSTNWYIPYSSSRSDEDATRRAIDFNTGWFLDPLTKGRYPESMQLLVKERLPTFTAEQAELIKGSYDFLGLNYYTTNYASDYSKSYTIVAPTATADSRANTTGTRNGVAIGPRAASSWLYMYPRGIKSLLLYVKERYKDPKIYITENGFSEANNSSISLKEALVDPMRIQYHSKHLYYIREAIREGVNVKGYFAWSLLDNFEWSSGYSIRFGIVFIDYKNGLKRHYKQSAFWFRKFLRD